MAEFKLISRNAVDEAWPLAAQYIQMGLDKSFGEWSIEDCKRACKIGRYDLWLVVEEGEVTGAFTTFFVQYPQFKVLEAAHAGSEKNRNTWPEAVEMLKEWAKTNGCTRFDFPGRVGWARALKALGFNLSYVKMSTWI